MPFIHTGFSVFLAFFSESRSTADAPSQGAEQSSSFTGSAILFEFITSCRLTGLRKRAPGFLAAFLWFLTDTCAICSSVVLYFLMCALANIDAQCTGKLKEPRVTSQTSLLPSLAAFSAPTTRAESHSPDAMS